MVTPKPLKTETFLERNAPYADRQSVVLAEYVSVSTVLAFQSWLTHELIIN